MLHAYPAGSIAIIQAKPGHLFDMELSAQHFFFLLCKVQYIFSFYPNIEEEFF